MTSRMTKVLVLQHKETGKLMVHEAEKLGTTVTGMIGETIKLFDGLWIVRNILVVPVAYSDSQKIGET